MSQLSHGESIANPKSSGKPPAANSSSIVIGLGKFHATTENMLPRHSVRSVYANRLTDVFTRRKVARLIILFNNGRQIKRTANPPNNLEMAQSAIDLFRKQLNLPESPI